MPKEEIEEYLEAIYDLAGKTGTAKTTEVAERLNLKPGSVTEVFRRLGKNKLVKYTPYKGVTLTNKGYEKAMKLKRKHRILERFLTDILGFDSDQVHEQACKMEHALSDEAEEALCKLLKGVDNCPHGTEIPPCASEYESCEQCILEKSESKRKSKKKK